MDRAIRHFRPQVRRLARGRSPRSVRYPVAVREAAVALGRSRLGQGHSVHRIAHELGISEPTLAGWLRPEGPAMLRPVTVAPDPEPRRVVGIVLIAAHGVRVEGLDRETLIAVLRALA
jgi:transposase-like protein